jgi:hypothetical protein
MEQVRMLAPCSPASASEQAALWESSCLSFATKASTCRLSRLLRRMQARVSDIVERSSRATFAPKQERRARQPLRVALRPQMGLPGGMTLCQVSPRAFRAPFGRPREPEPRPLPRGMSARAYRCKFLTPKTYVKKIRIFCRGRTSKTYTKNFQKKFCIESECKPVLDAEKRRKTFGKKKRDVRSGTLVLLFSSRIPHVFLLLGVCVRSMGHSCGTTRFLLSPGT